MSDLTPFYAMRSRFWKTDQLFKVYPTERGLAFAWIAGQINNEENARLMLQTAMLFLRGWGASQTRVNAPVRKRI